MSRRILGFALVVALLVGCSSREPYVRVDEDREVLAVGWPTLAAGDSGPRIRLVNTVHIADEAFFDEVQAALDGADIVFMEGIKGDGVAMRDLMKSYSELADLLGLAMQKDGIELRDAWRRPDVRDDEIGAALRRLPMSARLAVSSVRVRIERNEARVRNRFPELSEEEVARRARAPVRRDVAEQLADRDADDPVIIVMRNERLLDALDGELATASAARPLMAVCYGVGHSVHLVRELGRRGFEVEAVDWHDVFDFAVEVSTVP